jgi:hypothetical protein
MTLVESYSDLESTSPDDAARYLQVVFRYDQRERCRNRRAPIGKLQRGTCDREITNNATGLIATKLNLRWLRNAKAGRNSGFDQERSLPIQSIIVSQLIDPQQSRSTIQPNQPLFFGVIVGTHVQHELVLGDSEKAVARLTFGKRLNGDERIFSRSDEAHGKLRK